MNENDAIGIIVTHGNLAHELLSTVETIVGKIDFCYAISNADLNDDALIASIRKIIDEHAESYAILFVDYFGGSCSMSCSRAVKGYEKAVVISGINLPILLDFVTKRGTMKPEEIVRNLIRRGQESVRVIDP